MAIVREIKYFDYMENENKLGNAGHVKIDWWEDCKEGHPAEGSLQLRVSHLPMDNLPMNPGGEKTEIQLQTALGQVVLGNMVIDKGMGAFDCPLQLLQELLGDALTYEDVWSICIPLGGNTQVFCRIHEPQIVLAQEETVQEPMEEQAKAHPVPEVVNKERESGEGESADMVSQAGMEGVKQEAHEKAQEPSNLVSVPGSEDKWGHLCSIYPKITPFSDSREYLQISPNDFVLLNAAYYSLIHNSFMLHGYYQYGQLVLCRVIRRGRALYYLGTPGIYLEREKQVALMYGFQSFECDTEPAAEGDFGYYMIQVEL